MSYATEKLQVRGARTQEIMTAVKKRIAARTLSAGQRLPSIRAFAKSMGVSPSTVVEAYDRLAAEGLIKARPGSGFYVADNAAPPLTLAQDVPKKARAVDPFWVSRQSLDADPSLLKPGCGWLPDDWLPLDAVRKGLRAVARAESQVLVEYGRAHGATRLRKLLLARFGDEGLELTPQQLLLTPSGTQAVDLICRLILRPGDTALIDDPCYFNFRALLRAHQVNVVGVPWTASGPDHLAFEALLAAEKPRLYITNSALQNPTGGSISAQTAHRMLVSAAAHNLTIVEDDIFADFEPEPSARLASLDGLERVIRIGSFTKTISASLRCGYIAARPEMIEALVDLQIAINFGGPSPVATEVIAGILTGGSYRKHMEELRRKLGKARHDIAGKFSALGIEPLLMPRGGFYLWCKLPNGCNSEDVARFALDQGVLLAPGNVFSVSQTASAFMRFNIAHCSDPAVFDVLEKAINACRTS